jgi:hypothetical protein
VFNPPPAAGAKRKPSAYAKLEQANEHIARELDAAKAHIAELEAAQPDHGSLLDLDLKNDKPDNIAEAIIGNVDLRRAEEIAKAILLAISIKRRAAKARGNQSQTGRRARGTTSRAHRRTNRRAQRKAGTKKPKAG